MVRWFQAKFVVFICSTLNKSFGPYISFESVFNIITECMFVQIFMCDYRGSGTKHLAIIIAHVGQLSRSLGSIEE